MNTEEFISKSIAFHKNKYDYSQVKYINTHTKVCIICPIHGEFYQRPSDHLQGHGCPKCGNNCLTEEQFLKKANKIHKYKYNYSEVEYKKLRTEVKIICPIHGEFYQKPLYHLQGNGCPLCGRKSIIDKKKISLEEFKDKSNKIHNFKYSYDNVKKIKGSREKVSIICPIHGTFLQEIESHMRGCGCPKCSFSYSHLENDISILLKENNIEFEEQKKFEWLGKQSLDFYLPQYNVAIECQGEQHYRPIKFYGGERSFLKREKLDEEKKEKCEQHGISILYYSDFLHIPLNVIKDKNELIQKIKMGK